MRRLVQRNLNAATAANLHHLPAQAPRRGIPLTWTAPGGAKGFFVATAVLDEIAGADPRFRLAYALYLAAALPLANSRRALRTAVARGTVALNRMIDGAEHAPRFSNRPPEPSPSHTPDAQFHIGVAVRAGRLHRMIARRTGRRCRRASDRDEHDEPVPHARIVHGRVARHGLEPRHAVPDHHVRRIARSGARGR